MNHHGSVLGGGLRIAAAILAIVGSGVAGFFGSFGVLLLLLGGVYGFWPCIGGVALMVILLFVIDVTLVSRRGFMSRLGLMGSGVTVGLLLTLALYGVYVEDASRAGGCINGVYIGTCAR